MILGIDTSKLTDEENATVVRVSAQQVTITVPLGAAMVIHGLLKQAAIDCAVDALDAKLEGNSSRAAIAATVGSKLIDMIDAIHKGVKDAPGLDEIIAIADKHRDASVPIFDEDQTQTDKRTLQ